MTLARSSGVDSGAARAACGPGFYLATVVAALAVATTCVLHLRGFGGAFLSDDLTHLYFVAHMDREHLLARWVLARFVDPLNTGRSFPYLHFAYRPIAFSIDAVEWRLFGTWVPGWRIPSLGLHLANIVLVYCVASRWMLGRVRWHGWPMLPAALFAAFPFAGEAIFWPAASADVLAAFFSLLFLATFDGSPAASAYRQPARVMLLLAALLSKESALPLPVVAFVLDLALRVSREARSSRLQLGSHVRFAARDLAPSWLACAAYIGWRTVLFGTPLKVYRDSGLPASLAEYAQRLASYSGLLTRQPGIDPPWLWALVAAVLIAALLAGGIAGWRKLDRPAVALVCACAISALIYVLAPALSLTADRSVGDGGRNFYVPWIYVSLALGLAAASTRVSLVTGVATVGWMLLAQAGSLDQWQTAAREMRALLTAIPAFSQQLKSDQYALLLLPDHVGIAPFARDAEQAIVDWPVQTTDPIKVVVGMTELDIPAWRENLATGAIAFLKGTQTFDMNRFEGVFCWSAKGNEFARVAPPGPVLDFDAWVSELRARAGSSGCMPGTLSDGT